MALFNLTKIDLNDPRSYDPVGSPGAGDTVNGNSVSARGTLSVEEVTNFILTNGTVDAGRASRVTVGNRAGVDGSATMTIVGAVTSGAIVYSNGILTADSVQGGLTFGGAGTVNLRLGFDASAGLSMDKGTLNISGALSTGTAQSGSSFIFLTDGSKVTAASLSLGTGPTIISYCVRSPTS